jgi:hypothetical protein
MLYVVNLIGVIFYTFFAVISVRYIIYEGYLAPVYPFSILNLLGMTLFIVRKWDVKPLKFVTFLTLTYFLFFVLVKDFAISLPTEWARLRYQDTLAYKSYQYIETKIPKGKKIVYDHLVAIPSDRNLNGCQYWQGCGTDYIEQFNPDYVIFSPNWTFGGTTLPQTARLAKYTDDHHFILVDTIIGSVPSDSDDLSLEVWKKSEH